MKQEQVADPGSNAMYLLEKVGMRLSRYVQPPAPILVACSGGPDSIALALILRELNYEVSLAYVNHNLRGAESVREAQFVRDFAGEWAFPLMVHTLSGDAFQGKVSLQARARALRYAWMEALMNQHGIPWGATAHTWDDQMETFLYQLLRGGLDWDWRGIPYRRGRWLRPLLYVTRAQLIAYLRARRADYMLDHTNYTPKYLRNQIRWWVLPPMYRLNPDLQRLWREKAALARYQRQHLLRLYRRQEKKSFLITPYGEALVRQLPRDAFFYILRRRWRVDSATLRRLWQLWHQRRSGARYIQGDVLYVRTPSALERGALSQWAPNWQPLLIFPVPQTYRWGAWTIAVGEGGIDAGALVWDKSRLTFPLRVRLWRKGDRFAPVGLQGATKRVSDIWQEIGRYGFERQQAFVVEDGTGRLIGVVGYRVSQDTAVSPSTAETFYLRAQYGDDLATDSPPAKL